MFKRQIMFSFNFDKYGILKKKIFDKKDIKKLHFQKKTENELSKKVLLKNFYKY